MIVLDKKENKEGEPLGKVTRGVVATKKWLRKKKSPVFDCYYCKNRHVGGWEFCEKRKKEDPLWTPPDTKNNTNSGNSKAIVVTSHI